MLKKEVRSAVSMLKEDRNPRFRESSGGFVGRSIKLKKNSNPANCEPEAGRKKDMLRLVADLRAVRWAAGTIILGAAGATESAAAKADRAVGLKADESNGRRPGDASGKRGHVQTGGPPTTGCGIGPAAMP